MTDFNQAFQIGPYRPIYLWAGPGTIRMNRVKFMDQPVDEAVHHEAHTAVGVKRVLDEMYCNWVHLTYNWGFPPEIEQEDWESFQRGAAAFHAGGSKVFAYIQTSNCVHSGSFREKDWYARDHKGRKIFYYSGRYMSCFNNEDWKNHLKAMLTGAIQRGADGIFFDNLWFGAMPMTMFGAWMGPVGCHCDHCQALYQAETGQAIPLVVNTDDPAVARYLRWRADCVTALVAELAACARELQPGTPVSANDFDPITRDSYVVFGIDLKTLAGVQDITMIENYGLPRWDNNPQPRLANNALTIHTAQAIIKDAAHFSILSYDVGIGFDGVYSERRYQQGIAEAIAAGTSMTVKGTEYHDGYKHTLLTEEKYNAARNAIGDYNRRVEQHADLFSNTRTNAAKIGLLYPGEALALNWLALSPVYFGVGQALIAAGLPWRVVTPDDDLGTLDVLLTFETESIEKARVPAGLRTIHVPDLPDWEHKPASFVAGTPLLRSLLSTITQSLVHTYHASRIARRIMDRLGLIKTFTYSPLYLLPPSRQQTTLLSAIAPEPAPRVESDQPVLIETWQSEEELQIHLVNYAADPQRVTVYFDTIVETQALSFDRNSTDSYTGDTLEFECDIYTILRVKRS